MYSFYIFLTIVVAGTITKGVEIGTFPVPTDFKVPPYKLRHIWSGVHLGINYDWTCDFGISGPPDWD